MRRFFSSLFFLLLISFSLQAQYYLSGEDPASIKWHQLNTKSFRVIFAEDDELQAQSIAILLDRVYEASLFDLSSRPVKSDLILHNRSIISNASVAWAPRRLDFYTTPPQDGYAQPWMTQLAVHELRHVAQINRLNQGFGRFFYFAFGQQVTAGVLGVFVPLWFMEGDAVTNETSLSMSGCGRDGLFLSGLRAQILQKGYYPYDKAYFGSFRDYTPDIYELGYYLVAHNKSKYGVMELNKLPVWVKTSFTRKPFSTYTKNGNRNTIAQASQNWRKSVRV